MNFLSPVNSPPHVTQNILPNLGKRSDLHPESFLNPTYYYSTPIYSLALELNTDKKRRFSDTNTGTFIIDQTAKKFRSNVGPSPYPFTFPHFSYHLPSPMKDRKSHPINEEDINWICIKCGNDNFAVRKVCNMKKCGAPRPEETKLWKCPNCGNFNYPSRMKCNMKKCQAARPLPTFHSTDPGTVILNRDTLPTLIIGRDPQERMETDQDYEEEEGLQQRMDKWQVL